MPNVKDASWPRGVIDRFILANLEVHSLHPSPPATKYEIARRVSLDLTGLLSTPSEVDAFVNDANADSYERFVNRLLASPRFGEHRARYWLDYVRYGDTHGLHNDNQRDIWPYRDYVIRSFNANKPFDQFAIEQIAGDLLPRAMSISSSPPDSCAAISAPAKAARSTKRFLPATTAIAWNVMGRFFWASRSAARSATITSLIRRRRRIFIN